MQLLFEDDLVDAVVQLCAAGKRPGIAPLQLRRFHVERERCYQVPDPDDRAAAFARVLLAWFHEWGLDSPLYSAPARFPVLEPALTVLAYRKARGRNDEGAELFCDAEGRRRGIVALRPERFTDQGSLRRFLHHELAHVADMVDPHFGYSPELEQTGQTACQIRLTCERYRLLWDVSIDGRLHQSGVDTVADEAQRRRAFDRGFAFLAEEQRDELFAALWRGGLAQHLALLKIATDPRGLQGQHTPVPGAACPLCGFATFQWTGIRQIRQAARKRIQDDFPGWCESAPVCARCAEMYDAITGLEYPATVCL